MKKQAIALSCALGFFAVPSRAEDGPKIEPKPLSIGALSEFGELGKGIYKIGKGNVGEIWTNDWIDHFGAFITKEAVIDDRLILSGGLGGVFQFRKPELVDPGFYGSQRKGFFVGPTKATAEYRFGDVAAPWLSVTGGMFMYKYNPEAYDLGEYLYRSGAYPGYTSTGGYVLVNSAAANVQGVKASLAFGDFKADIILNTETNLAPLYDFSLGTVLDYSIGDGLLDIGAGVNFKRLIQVRPSRTTPKRTENGYVNIGGTDYSTNSNYYSRQVSYWTAKGTPEGDAKAAALHIKDSLVQAAVFDTSASKPAIHYYTNAGTLAMARATLDLKKLFGSEIFGPQDLKLYSELAVLGIKNYPVFYTKISERMPIMAGINLPTFRLLDLFAVQVEQYKSPWLNNTSQIANGGIPLPHFPIESDSIASKDSWNDLATKDNLKWSVLLQKKLGNYVTVSAQAANDHLRLTSSRYFYGPQFDHNEVTVSKDHWYWMTQISWGI